jgi:cytochrome b subunit of formate dehydrogenase
MKERIHEQISNELRQASRTDTTISVIAIVITFVMFGLALGFAFNTTRYNYGINYSSSNPSMNVVTYATIIMFVSLVAIVLINWFSILALSANKTRKTKLTENLMKLYQEEGLNQYYDDTISKGYEARRNLFTAILVTIAASGVIIPLVVFINKLVTEM